MTLLNSTRFDYNEQSIAGMFQPDPITPYDYLRTARRTVHLEPEKHLMHAILEEAIKTFRMHVSTQSARERRLFLDAQLWIMARNDDWLFSFENICEVLGLDPNFVRSGLARWREQHVAPALVRKTARRQRAVVRPASP